MNVVSFGGGTNSTAMIIGMYLHRIPVDLILFADTGGEQPHTYEFIGVFNEWLEKRGLPKITPVYYTDKNGNRLPLEEECLRSKTLPSIAYGFKKCSLKHKIGPQEKFCNNNPECREEWAAGGESISISVMTQGKRGGFNTRPRRMKRTKSMKITIRFMNGAGTGPNASA